MCWVVTEVFSPLHLLHEKLTLAFPVKFMQQDVWLVMGEKSHALCGFAYKIKFHAVNFWWSTACSSDAGLLSCCRSTRIPLFSSQCSKVHGRSLPKKMKVRKKVMRRRKTKKMSQSQNVSLCIQNWNRSDLVFSLFFFFCLGWKMLVQAFCKWQGVYWPAYMSLALSLIFAVNKKLILRKAVLCALVNILLVLVFLMIVGLGFLFPRLSLGQMISSRSINTCWNFSSVSWSFMSVCSDVEGIPFRISCMFDFLDDVNDWEDTDIAFCQ